MGGHVVTQTVLLTTVVITAISYFGIVIYRKWNKVKIPSNWEKVGTLKKLHLYPLKSGYRTEMEKAEMTHVGLKQIQENVLFQLRDRVFVVYQTKNNEYCTAKTHYKMVNVKVSVQNENLVAMDAPSMETLHVKIPKRGVNSTTDIKCLSYEKIQGIDCGDEAASWFSRYILENENGLRLAYNDATQKRDITKAHHKIINYYKLLTNESTGLFSAYTSASLIAVPSVNDLNKRVNSEIVAEQFRHNLIVDGLKLKPYDEDDWDWIRVGDEVVLRNVKNCTRCIESTVNPENGVRHPEREPLKTLLTYRKHAGPETSAPKLGILLGVIKTGFIQVGDSVYVSRK